MDWFLVFEALFGASVVWALANASRSWVRAESAGRIEFIDALKGLAILFVVAIHVTDLYPQFIPAREVLWAALPFFVLASGYVLSLRPTFDAKRYFRNFALNLVVVYALFTVLFFLLDRKSLLSIPTALLFGRVNGDYYFIPLLAQLYLLYPLLRKAKAVLTHPLSLSALFVVSLLLWRLDWSLQQPTWNSNEWSLIFCGRYLFWFVLGMYLSDKDLSRFSARATWPLVLIYALGVALVYGWLHTVYLLFVYPVVALLLLLWLWRVAPKLFSWCASLGPLTLVIYLVHARFVYNWGGQLLAKLLPSPALLGLVFVTALTAVVSGLVAWLFNKGYAALLRALQERGSPGSR